MGARRCHGRHDTREPERGVKRIVLVVVLLVVGGLVGVVAYRRVLANERAAATGALRLHGNVELRDAQLAFFSQELVATVLVEEGDRVEQGQLLATLRTERLDAEIAAAQAAVASQQALVDRLQHGTRPEEIEQARSEVTAAEVRAANGERDVGRLQATVGKGAASAQALDDAQAALDVARADLAVRQQALALALAGPRQEDRAQAQATLDQRRAELDVLDRRRVDSELRAPASGTIRSRVLEPGETASPERPAFTLALDDPKWVRAWVPEPELGRIALGLRATIRSDSFGGRSYEGWIGFISPVAEFTPKTVETDELRTLLVYEVHVFVKDPEHELPLGIPVTVDVDLGSRGDGTGQ
jgi:HlyD family secretion protein